jgi:asparagine synthase (glutamine-hydrolysing)
MCGIFALLNHGSLAQDKIQTQFQKGRNRGPEYSVLAQVSQNALFGFHRLAINGLNPESNQPLVKNGLTLICNGEIYNYTKLYDQMYVNSRTQSDCEVILWLYEKYGIEQCLQMLDGVFAFVLLDERSESSVIHIARDPYGVRPLYILEEESSKHNLAAPLIGFASELKSLSAFERPVSHFPPGHYASFVQTRGKWTRSLDNTPYHRMPFPLQSPSNLSSQQITAGIRAHLIAAVEKRCQTTERPIACLLSGGLDSSLITALVHRYHRNNNLAPIETYSIGLAGSVDLHYARLVADYLGTKHTEIVLTEKDFTDAIPRVIEAIESYDTTSVRASIGNFLLGEYISKNSQAKVIFNGDGSDELLGGYLYMNQAPDAIEFDRECRRLLRDIHAFDVLRSDKSISSHGLEPRTPFLDRYWTQYYLSLPVSIRFQPDKPEKYWLRSAFSEGGWDEEPLLPREVVWRRKEAFSDGVSGQERSLYQILQEYSILSLSEEPNQPISIETSEAKSTAISHAESQAAMDISTNPPKTAEQWTYRKIFERLYPGFANVVPYFWMPKYVEAKDASARTLAIY